MALTKKGLGRGLSALIPDAEMDALSDITREKNILTAKEVSTPKKSGKHEEATFTSSSEDTATATTHKKTRNALPGEKASSQTLAIQTGNEALMLATKAISPNPFQPRRTFGEEELEDLASSIRLHGIIQPILVRPTAGKSDSYQLVAGERRWRAAQMAGLDNVPVIVRPMADQQALELALIENVQRHDISSIDAALAYERLAKEFDLSQEQISRRVGKSRSAVANTMRLLTLPEEVRKSIEEGLITEGHGRAILLAASEGARRAIFRRVVRDKLSVRDTEQVARASTLGQDEKSNIEKNESSAGTFVASSRDKSSEWVQFERDITKKLGARTKIRASSKRGTIVIECGSDSEVRRVLAVLQGAR